MSESFDREAEREKLRKQLEKEEKAREATRHMSELLLKGATMTNKHCEECGDPIFRHQDTEFCPTCQRSGQTESGEAAPNDGDSENETNEGQEYELDKGPAEVAVETPDVKEDTQDPTTEASSTGTKTDVPSRGSAMDTTSPKADYEAETGEGDIEQARTALSRKLLELAMEVQAEQEIGRTRELLAATREAAEALSVVDKIRR